MLVIKYVWLIERSDERRLLSDYISMKSLNLWYM